MPVPDDPRSTRLRRGGGEAAPTPAGDEAPAGEAPAGLAGEAPAGDEAPAGPGEDGLTGPPPSPPGSDPRATVLRSPSAGAGGPGAERETLDRADGGGGGRDTILRGAPGGDRRGPGGDRGAPPAFPTRRARFETYRPPSGRRRTVILGIAAGIVAVAAGVGTYLATTSGGKVAHHPRRPPVTAPRPAPALAVVAASVTVTSPGTQLGCGAGPVGYRAVVTTSGGAGTLAYQWTYPDGSTGQASQITVAKGQTNVTLSLSFTFSGVGQAQGVASLAVHPVAGPTQAQVAPTRADGPLVTYHCA